jgi:hypothetical protein
MKEICIVTTYQREELLWLCLEAIRANDANVRICVFSDRGANSEDLQTTLNQFAALSVIRERHRFYGNSWNLLTACRWLTDSADELPGMLHLIEDDTLIHHGYLKWARTELINAQLAGMNLACVCGRIGSPHITDWYESPCASWQGEYLQKAVSHVIPEYFCDDRLKMQKVLDEKIFPNSKYKKGGAEQDGFLLRCVEHYKWKTRFPEKPLATHLGWYGYNQPPLRGRPQGSFADRIQQCREMLGNRERRKELFGHRIAESEWTGRETALAARGLCSECGGKEDAAKTFGGHNQKCTQAIPF